MTIENAHPHDGPVIDSKDGQNIIECQCCGFRHQWPMPDAATITRIYQDEYYVDEKPQYFQHYEEDADWWNLVYDDRLDLFAEHLPAERRRLLDIGSGPGLFLARARDRGWQTLGIEPSRQAAAYATAKGLEIRNEFLTPATAGLGRFDAIHLSAVLEHIPDPLAMLELAQSMLTPGGMICVVVPNDYNPIQLAAREACNIAPWWIAPPHHINYFTPQSLTGCLERTGFDSIQLSTTFPIDMFLLMGDNYTGNPELGRACHKKRQAFEFALHRAGQSEIRKAWYQSMIQVGIGREIVIYGRKP
jgi:SAM-dependent methyltransferase